MLSNREAAAEARSGCARATLDHAGPVQEMRLTANSGLVLKETEQVLLKWEDLVGCFKAEPASLRFVAYERPVAAPGCCGGDRGPRPRRRAEHVLVFENTAEGLASREEFEKFAWEQGLLRDFARANEGRTRRRFLVLINPNGGSGHAQRTFERECRQVFLDAQMDCTIQLTAYAGHAQEIAQNTPDLSQVYDGLVTVSGDGLLYEVIQGIMARADWKTVVQKMTLGVLPGGSGNGLAISLAKGSGEAMGARSNAFLIAKGYTAPMDIWAMDHCRRGRLYAFLSLEFAFIADVDIESEWMRALGDFRFTIQVIRRLMHPRVLRSKLSWLPALEDRDVPTPRHAGVPRAVSYWSSEASQVSDAVVTDLLPASVEDPVPSSWRTVEDDYYCLWANNVAYMSAGSVAAPHSTWDDGYCQMNIVRRNGPGGSTPRKTIAEFVLGVDTGAHVRRSPPAAELFPCRAFRLEPSTEAKSRTKMAVDGERVELGPIQCQVLSGLMRLVGARPLTAATTSDSVS